MPPEGQRLLPVQVHLLTLMSVFAFDSNSLLCRLAFKHSTIDAASFTSVRLVTGAIVLGVIVRLRRGEAARFAGDWPSAIALFIYAAGFSWAYLTLPAATGRRVLPVLVVAHGCWGHCGAHRCGGAGDGVRTQVDRRGRRAAPEVRFVSTTCIAWTVPACSVQA